MLSLFLGEAWLAKFEFASAAQDLGSVHYFGQVSLSAVLHFRAGAQTRRRMIVG
jgi:hypothetical protein